METRKSMREFFGSEIFRWETRQENACQATPIMNPACLFTLPWEPRPQGEAAAWMTGSKQRAFRLRTTLVLLAVYIV